MGIFNDLEFKKKSGHIVVPDTDKVGGKTLSEFKNMFKAPVIIGDADSMITVPNTSFDTSYVMDIFSDLSCKVFYPLNGNTNDVGNNYTGTATNITYAQGKFDQCAVFNGTSKISSPQVGLNNIGKGSCTVTCWVKPSNLNGVQCFVYLGSFGSNQIHFGFSSGTLWGGTGNGTTWGTISSGSALTANVWTYVTMVVDRINGILKFYKNGIQVYSGAYTSMPTTTTSPILLGTQDDSINYYNGSMDQVRIFNRALTASEVLRLYTETGSSGKITINQQSTEPDWVKYQFIAKNFVTSSNLDPYISLLMNGNDLLDKTGKVLTNTGPVTVDTTIKKFGTGSLYFNNSSYLSVPSSEAFNFGTGDFTVEAWVYLPSRKTTYAATIFDTDGSNSLGQTLTIDASGKVGFWHNASMRLLTSTIVPLTTWTHIALVRFSGITAIYINGAQDTSTSYSYSPAYANPRIGGNPSTTLENFLGYIDDLRVTKGVAKYTAINFTPPTSEFTLDTVINNRSITVNGKTQEILRETTIGDVYFNNVSLLLTGNDLLDKTGKILTNIGSVSLDSINKKVGTASLKFNGVNYLSVAPGLINFGYNDFTIETWVKLDAISGTGHKPIISLGTSGSNWLSLYLADYSNTGNYFIECGIIPSNASYVDLGYVNNTTGKDVVVKDVWFHIAIVKNGNIYKLFKDGILIHSITNSSLAILDFNSNLLIGAGRWVGENRYFQGNLDDIRITTGIARYTSNFTPSVNELQYGYTQTTFKPVMGDTRSLNISYTGTLDSVDINTYILD